MKFKAWIEAPKFAGVPSFLKTTAWQLDIEIKVDVDSGWWFETVRFEVNGEENKVRKFQRILKQAIEEYLED